MNKKYRLLYPLLRDPVRFWLLAMLILSGSLALSGCREQKKVTPVRQRPAVKAAPVRQTPAVKTPSARQNPLVKVAPADLPTFTDTFSLKNLGTAIDQSLIYFRRVPSSRTYHYGQQVYDAAHMIASLETLKSFLETQPSVMALNRFIRQSCTVYKSVGGADRDVLFTGYFEPTYPGSRTPGPAYPWPVYAMPGDLFKIDLSAFSDAYKGHKPLMARIDPDARRMVPYYTRRQINTQSGFAQKARPVVWLSSRIDRFFLEIQGSGRVALPDNRIIRLHYAGANGRRYSAVGKYLIQKNEIPREKMSMQAIREWLTAHPDRMDEVLSINDSFVFFKEGRGGPFGCINVALTPVRSIATDSKLFPRGGLAFIQTALPEKAGQPKADWPRVSLFVLNQDTGGAIRGPARVDLFCGANDWANYAAGHMAARGQLYFIVLNSGR